MLTPRQNFIETLKTDGNPDRYVKQFEAIHLLMETPYNIHSPEPWPGQKNIVNAWGVTNSWPEGTPGAFPLHDEKHLVCKDITRWREYIHAPNLEYPESEWDACIKESESVDRNSYFVSPFISPGIFEQCHYLMEIQNCLINFYEEPEYMKEIIEYITEWNLLYAEKLCKYVKPDLLFQHDDWGTQISTFISPDMFEEFLLPSYKKLYRYYKEHGVQYIVHHSDSYAATLVPFMIEMGIDVWQGVMRSNNIPELIEKYGGKITFMGGVDSALVDTVDWSDEKIQKEVDYICGLCGKKFFIPCQSQGGPISTFEGVYEAIDFAIGEYSKKVY